MVCLACHQKINKYQKFKRENGKIGRREYGHDNRMDVQ